MMMVSINEAIQPFQFDSQMIAICAGDRFVVFGFFFLLLVIKLIPSLRLRLRFCAADKLGQLSRLSYIHLVSRIYR